jgi:hypothetical protein
LADLIKACCSYSEYSEEDVKFLSSQVGDDDGTELGFAVPPSKVGEDVCGYCVGLLLGKLLGADVNGAWLGFPLGCPEGCALGSVVG